MTFSSPLSSGRPRVIPANAGTPLPRIAQNPTQKPQGVYRGTMPDHDPDAQRRILHRLRRARGQLDAVISAVEQQRPCRDVVIQLAAVSRALDRAGFAIVSTALKDCLADDGEADRPDGLTTEELEKLFLMLA